MEGTREFLSQMLADRGETGITECNERVEGRNVNATIVLRSDKSAAVVIEGAFPVATMRAIAQACGEDLHIITVSDAGANSAMKRTFEHEPGVEHWRTSETLFNRMRSSMAPRIERVVKAADVPREFPGGAGTMLQMHTTDFACRYMGCDVGDVISSRCEFGEDVKPFTQDRVIVSPQ